MGKMEIPLSVDMAKDKFAQEEVGADVLSARTEIAICVSGRGVSKLNHVALSQYDFKAP